MIPTNTKRFFVRELGTVCPGMYQEHLWEKSSTGCNTTGIKVRDEAYKGLQILEEDK
jgi:hypothetical protein